MGVAVDVDELADFLLARAHEQGDREAAEFLTELSGEVRDMPDEPVVVDSALRVAARWAHLSGYRPEWRV